MSSASSDAWLRASSNRVSAVPPDRPTRARKCDLTTQYRQLISQHQDLRLFGGIRPRQQSEPAEKTDEDQIEQA
jgi:hypothetical protein